MIKLIDILNESYNPNVYQIECRVVMGAGNRPIQDIISDIRAIPGVTVVDTIESDYNTEEGRHVTDLSIKIDPSPFNPFDRNSYIKILNDIKKLPDVRGAKYISSPIVTENKLQRLIKEALQKKKRDRCLRIADRKYDKPSAYKSGAVVRCRKGEIWKDLKEFEGDSNPLKLKYIDTWHDGQYKANDGKTEEAIKLMTQAATEAEKMAKEKQDGGMAGEANYYKGTVAWLKKDYNTVEKYINDKFVKATGNDEVLKRLLNNKDKSYKEAYHLNEEKETLRTWFKRKGAPGKEGGWVDCNAPIRKDGKITGYKACGRKKGEKRAKYPSCRPTAAQCKTPGKGKKWGKTK